MTASALPVGRGGGNHTVSACSGPLRAPGVQLRALATVARRASGWPAAPDRRGAVARAPADGRHVWRRTLVAATQIRPASEDVMGQRATGWALVAGQVVLLVALVLTPQGTLWPTPPWVVGASWVVSGAGVVWAVWAALRLGDRLTPTPVPRDGGELRVEGPYAHVRHPIYTGVLLIVLGIALRTGSGVGLALGVVTVGFFHAKAAFEERLLADRFPGYARYAAATPRFVPRPWRARSG